jgi:hypothetical protein
MEHSYLTGNSILPSTRALVPILFLVFALLEGGIKEADWKRFFVEWF